MLIDPVDFLKQFEYLFPLKDSKTCLKRTPSGPENLSSLDRCPPYRGYIRFEQYDEFLGHSDRHTSSR